MGFHGMHGHTVRQLIALVADVAAHVSQRQPGFDLAVNRIGGLNDPEVLDLTVRFAPTLLFPTRRPLGYAIERVSRITENFRGPSILLRHQQC